MSSCCPTGDAPRPPEVPRCLTLNTKRGQGRRWGLFGAVFGEGSSPGGFMPPPRRGAGGRGRRRCPAPGGSKAVPGGTRPPVTQSCGASSPGAESKESGRAGRCRDGAVLPWGWVLPAWVRPPVCFGGGRLAGGSPPALPGLRPWCPYHARPCYLCPKPVCKREFQSCPVRCTWPRAGAGLGGTPRAGGRGGTGRWGMDFGSGAGGC